MSFARKIAAGIAVAAVSVLALASPASAHDQLVSSSPAADERLDTAPENVTMRFSGQLLTLGDSMTGAIVLVVDQDGTDWATGDVTVTGDTVVAEVQPDMPVAGYQVRWQVVSEDGHTIAGVIPFTIGDAEPMASEAASGDTGSDSEQDSAGDAQTTQETGSDSGDVLRIVLIGAGGAVIALAAFFLYRFLRRRSAAASSAQGASGSDDVDDASDQDDDEPDAYPAAEKKL